uniref:Uncharacterized protein n=1 Tax=Glossina palpalis gambiensis TaxID=67801 RepID=A0A1B0BIN8_9MUSC
MCTFEFWYCINDGSVLDDMEKKGILYLHAYSVDNNLTEVNQVLDSYIATPASRVYSKIAFNSSLNFQYYFIFSIVIIIYRQIVYLFSFTQEETESESFFWEKVKDIYHETRCHALCFTPDTSLMIIPKNVTFCAAGSDFLLRIFRTDLQNSDTVQTLKGHTNYVNEISWSNKCEFLALVSDDNSCKIWCFESNYDNIITFCLSSAGMSVKWHPDDLNKVTVAEKKGFIHMYNHSATTANVISDYLQHLLIDLLNVTTSLPRFFYYIFASSSLVFLENDNVEQSIENVMIQSIPFSNKLEPNDDLNEFNDEDLFEMPTDEADNNLSLLLTEKDLNDKWLFSTYTIS